MIGDKQVIRTFDRMQNPHTNAKGGKGYYIKNQGSKSDLSGAKKESVDYSAQKEIVVIEKFDTAASILKDLLSKGFVNSFIDIFYIASQKTPNIKRKYKKHYEIEDTAGSSNAISKVDLKDIKKLSENLQDAEGKLLQAMAISLEEKSERQKLRKIQKTLLEETISLYGKIRNNFYTGSINLPNAIYFDHKQIEISTKYHLETALIRSYLQLGNCFNNTKKENDLKLSMFLKEEAKVLFKGHEKDDNLENDICNALVNLYKDLAFEEETISNYSKSIEYLSKQLENLKAWRQVCNDTVKIDNDQVDVYLKVANLNYQLHNYQETLDCIQILKDFISSSGGENIRNNNSYQLKCYFLSAQTYEKLNDYDKAITELKKVETIEKSTSSSEDPIYAKSFLNLGRLFFRQEDYKQASTNLSTFFNQAKKIDNELLDLARVNLGMVNGTQNTEEYIKKIRNSDFKDFLNLKLTNFADK